MLCVCRYDEYQDTSSIRDVVLSMRPLVTSEEILLRRNKSYKTGMSRELFNPSTLSCNKLERSQHTRLITISSIQLEVFLPTNLRYLLDKRR